MHDHWIGDRARNVELAAIRRVFELARSRKNIVNLSIGQPNFDVPEPIKAAAHAAIDQGHNGYSVAQGIQELRDKIAADLRSRYSHPDREVLITSGASGGLVLALMVALNPGDEVIVFDPYFAGYPHFVTLAGGEPVWIDTYPDFDIDLNKGRDALTPRTKMIIVNSPGNPTGKVLDRETLRGLALLARERKIMLVSDELYRSFCYDQPFASPAEFSDEVVVVDGFGKTYGMTGWRLGFCHGPRRFIDEMSKLQQCIYVCAPSMAQHAGIAAWDLDMSRFVRDYQRKRDWLCDALKDQYEFVKPGGAFYLFARVPWGDGASFVAEAIAHDLLLLPGQAFSRRDTHFRISYAVSDVTLERGATILQRLAARSGPARAADQ
ncbi:MAG: aminotransferase class I/II-fold pyridoxal phosphate-dependent enzyme [Planctomycetes bacterium]|nr:aminotransferase class I/II-fold pyridoxal phosphate-dependent enzyme [Planctomycetota bacterium]